jgi:hypothetical protein
MAPDPVPDNPWILKDPNGSKVTGYPHRVDWACLAHALELETRVSGVDGEGSVCRSSLVLNFRRELAKQLPKSGARS